jgi:hypothetical protein
MWVGTLTPRLALLEEWTDHGYIVAHVYVIEDVKVAMGPIHFYLFILVCPRSSPSFGEKDEWCLDTQFGSCYACFGHVMDTRGNNMLPS